MSDAKGGDVLLANGNVIPVEKAGVQYTEKGQQTTEKKESEGGEENAEDETI